MPLLKMITACGSELNKIVFHSGRDSEGYANALKMLDDLLPVGQEVSLDKLISQIEGMGFKWGVKRDLISCRSGPVPLNIARIPTSEGEVY